MLADIITDRTIDIVNIHNWAIFIESWLAVRKAGMAGVIMTVHGPYTDYGSGIFERFKKMFRHFCERIVARSLRVKKIITVSDSIQEYILSDIGLMPEKLVTIHNGIKPLSVKRSSETGPGLRLITVGRLADIKNHRMMLDAVKLVKKEDIAVQLTIVGDGPKRLFLTNYAQRLGIGGNVRFLGFRSDIDSLLAEHDAFVLSSDYEGISIALLEAMSLAKPAIATNVGGISEMIQNGYSGLIVEKGDSRSFADAIIKLALSRDTCLELGNNALQYFNSKFHEDIVIGEYNKLYESCLENDFDK